MGENQEREVSGAEYDVASIQVLEGLEPVRKRPGMYIGSTDTRGLHHLVVEIVDNSVDEALAGFCTRIDVTLEKNGSCTVVDNGRGIPVGIHPKEGVSTVELVLTRLHAGGKFGGGGYKVSGGLHGVGMACVNALSEWLEVEVARGGKLYRQTYNRGVPQRPLAECGTAEHTGTKLTFFPDDEIFETLDFDFDYLKTRLREVAYLNKGLIVALRDERGEEAREEIFRYDGGIKDFVNYLNRNKETLFGSAIYIEKVFPEGEIEIALQYNDTYNDVIYSYANNINTEEGGTHLEGFKNGLTKVINDIGHTTGVLKDADKLSGDDVREGIVAVISVKLSEPQFEGQTKTKLGNSEMRTAVSRALGEGFGTFLEETPAKVKELIARCLTAQRAREAARNARDLTRRKSVFESNALPGKLADCTDRVAAHCEVYLVEGDSAGGSAKQGRDRRFQAILPLRGKILNVEKARMDKALENLEIKAMITAFGCGIAEDFDESKLRYDRIICMTDADVDGSHIRLLLLTFFFRFMRPLLEKGHVYIAQPPLYKVAKGNRESYAYSDAELDAAYEEIGRKGSTLQRYKGLGEMNPEQLWSTTMNPGTRTLLRVSMEDAAVASELFTLLMGEEPELRREFIEQNATIVKELDI